MVRGSWKQGGSSALSVVTSGWSLTQITAKVLGPEHNKEGGGNLKGKTASLRALEKNKQQRNHPPPKAPPPQSRDVSITKSGWQNFKCV